MRAVRLSFALGLRVGWSLLVGFGFAGGLAACEGSADDPPARAGAARAHYVYAPQSPVFLLLRGADDHYLAALAAKDAQGNPQALIGFVFGRGQDYLRYEVDAEGRPRRLQTADELVLYAYEDSELVRHHYTKDSAEKPRRSKVDEQALKKATLAPLSLALVEKDSSGLYAHIGEWIAAAAERSLANLAALDACNAKLRAAALGSDALLACAAADKASDARFALPAPSRTLVDELYHLKDVASCLQSLGTKLGDSMACSAAVAKVIANLGYFVGSNARAFGALGPEALRVDGALRQNESSMVTLTLEEVLGTRGIDGVVVDLSEIGGPAALALAGNGLRWSARAKVTPTEAGERFVRANVNGERFGPTQTAVYVYAESSGRPLVVTLDHALRPAVVSAHVEGGTEPYRYLWSEDGRAVEDWSQSVYGPKGAPDASEVLVEVLVRDGSLDYPRFAHAQITVPLCDDDDECAALAMDGGATTDAAVPEDGGAAGDSGAQQDSGTSSGTDAGTSTGLSVSATTLSVGLGGYACLLRGDGAAWCWGNANIDGSVRPDTTTAYRVALDDLSTISVGFRHACGVTRSGSVSCWGRNFNGVFGDGKYGDQPQGPVMAMRPADALAVTASDSQTCVITTAGTVECCGNPLRLSLGDTTRPLTQYQLEYKEVPGISRATSLSISRESACVVQRGEVWCWGQGFHGQPMSYVPQRIAGIDDAVEVSVGGGVHTCVLRAGGSVACWGSTFPSLGDGTTTVSDTPLEIPGISGARAVAAANGYTCVLLGSGKVMCWGLTGTIKVDPLAAREYAVPTEVEGVEGAVALAAHTMFACAALGDDSVRCWGPSTSYAGDPRTQVVFGAAQ